MKQHHYMTKLQHNAKPKCNTQKGKEVSNGPVQYPYFQSGIVLTWLRADKVDTDQQQELQYS